MCSIVSVAAYVFVGAFLALPPAQVASTRPPSAAGATTGPATPTAEEIVRRALARQDEDDAAQENYGWTERDVTRFLGGDGSVKKTEDRTYDVSQVHFVEYRRLVARDGRPLSSDEAAKEQKKFDAFIRSHTDDSPQQVERYKRQRQKEVDRNRKVDAEILKAFAFTLVGEAATPYGPAWRIHAEPRPGYRAAEKDVRFMQHLRGDMLIDQKSYGSVRLDVQVLDTVSFGWVVAKLEKGGTLTIEQQPVDGHWFARGLEGALAARVMMVKGYHVTFANEYRDYKRFGSTTRITGVEEVK